MIKISPHFPAVLLAIAIGAATLVPQLIALHALGDQFAGVYPINNDDELYYQVRAHEVLDGYPFLTNPYLYEHKDGSPMQFWLPDYIEARLASLLSQDFKEGYIVFDFLLPLLLALLTYALVYKLSRSTTLALLVVVFLHLGLFVEDFNRAPSPQLTFVFFLLFLYALFSYLRLPQKRFLVLAAIALGLQFNFYPYHWTYTLAALGIFFSASFFLDKDFKIKPYLMMLAGGGVLGIPYFFALAASMRNPFYEESVYRLGLIDTHLPSGFSVVTVSVTVLLFAAFLYYKKIVKIQPIFLLVTSIVVGGIFVMNHHVLTGRNLEFSSHYFMPAMFGIAFLFSYLIGVYMRCIGERKKWMPFALCCMLAILVIPYAVTRTKNTFEKQSVPSGAEQDAQRYAPVFDWLQHHSEKESVVYADARLSAFIPAYTHNNVFYAREANLFFLSDEEVKERFVVSSFFHEPFDRAYMLKNERAIWGVHYIDERGHKRQVQKLTKILRMKTSSVATTPPEEELQEVMRIRDDIMQKGFTEAIKSYRLDYVVWDKIQHPNWQLDMYPYFYSIAELESFTVYEVL